MQIHCVYDENKMIPEDYIVSDGMMGGAVCTELQSPWFNPELRLALHKALTMLNCA